MAASDEINGFRVPCSAVMASIRHGQQGKRGIFSNRWSASLWSISAQRGSIAHCHPPGRSCARKETHSIYLPALQPPNACSAEVLNCTSWKAAATGTQLREWTRNKSLLLRQWVCILRTQEQTTKSLWQGLCHSTACGQCDIRPSHLLFLKIQWRQSAHGGNSHCRGLVPSKALLIVYRLYST